MAIKSISLAAIALVLSTSAKSALIDNGDITTDTITGLEWLDATLSADKSYKYVSSQFGIGGEFEGWRYATSNELSSFFDSAGGGGEYIGASESHSTFVPELIEMWGITAVWAANTSINALLADTPSDGQHYYTAVYDMYSYTNRNDYINLFEGSWNDTRTWYGVSSALVRTSAVPVPAAVWLFGSGLVGLIGITRRKKS